MWSRTPPVSSQPNGLDESAPGCLFAVNYRDGNRQALQSFVAADSFVGSPKAQGVALVTDRNSGGLASDSCLCMPSYFLTPLSAEDSPYWRHHKDALRLAYRVSGVNGDGPLDFSVLSGEGARIVYALAPWRSTALCSSVLPDSFWLLFPNLVACGQPPKAAHCLDDSWI